MISEVFATINLSEFYTDTINWVMTPFRSHLGVYVWPSIFVSVIAFVYVATKNLGSVLATTLLIFGLFGSTSSFIEVPEFKLFSSIIAIAGLAGLVMSLFIKKHG